MRMARWIRFGKALKKRTCRAAFLAAGMENILKGGWWFIPISQYQALPSNSNEICRSRAIVTSQLIILNHALWRKGAGGAPAGLIGQADSFAYAGLDLNLAQFVSTAFTGTSFTATTFQNAGWTACQFNACTFTACDFQSIAITGCNFIGCTFSNSQFSAAKLSGCTFNRCTWNNLGFDNGQWTQVDILNCNGTQIHADGLRGEMVDFTGSYFEQLEFRNAQINTV